MALFEKDHSMVKVDPSSGEETLIHHFSDPTFFEDAALIFGDLIHNLSCALDYAWFEALTRMAPTVIDGRIKFPARENTNELKDWLHKIQLDMVSPPLYRFMLDEIAVQPGWQWAICPLHRMDNLDKHKLLLPVLSHVHIKGIEVEDETGTRRTGFGVSAELQKPPYCIRYRRGLHVTNKGELIASIMIEDVRSGETLDLIEAATRYAYSVTGVVKLFEAFLELEGS